MRGWPFNSDASAILAISMMLGVFVFFAVLLTPIVLVGFPAYVGWRWWRESPARLERVARRETERLYDHAQAGVVQLSEAEIDAALMRYWPGDVPEALALQLLAIGKEIYAAEGLSPEIPPIPALCNTVEGGRYRDLLARLGQARHDRVMLLSALEVISKSLAPIAHAVPSIEADTLVSVEQFLHPLGHTIEAVAAPYFEETGYNLFRPLRDRLDANLTATHRTNPVLPREYKGEDILNTYLQGTPLRQLFGLKTPFAIPEARRFEHCHIVAGSGHGKTQTMQHMIAQDLKDVAAGAKSVVVIDSQGDMIQTILKAKLLDPDQIVLIDPEDIGWPVSLNLFSVGQDRLDSYSPLERERLTNSIIELYDFVLGSLLSAGMTAKQSVVFRYVTRLMFHIPDATIHTLRELMEPGGTEKYHASIEQLSGTPRQFFETEFDSKEFASTKTQVLRRLYGVLENQTFERMFSNPTSKFDMFTELNAGKLILVNTAKSLLKEQGTEIFGRFFIALIAQAAQERATLPKNQRLPAIVYVDEAQDYFDQNIGVILSQARKYQVGMVLAHQYLGQLTGGLQEAFEANTSIKLAGGVSARDARVLALQMGCPAEIIQQQPKGTFATYIRGLTERAVPMNWPFFTLEKFPQTTKDERATIRQQSRARYAEPWVPKTPPGDTSPDAPNEPPPKNDDDDPFAPTPEL